MTTLGVGMVGYGFMGRMHTHAYLSLPFYYRPAPARIRLVGVCTSRPETAQAAAQEAGYEFATAHYRDLLDRNDIHLIHCCTPNAYHYDLLMDAIAAGKHIYCDKPLAMNSEEAERICEAARNRPQTYQITFHNRFIPALLRARQLVEEGFLGAISSFRAVYLHTGYLDPERPMSWRLEKEKSGGGALVDLGSHLIDLIRHLLGDYTRILALTKTVVTDRPVRRGSDAMQKVDVDDAAWLLTEMASGATGTLEASRIATGVNDDLRLEIHGSEGALAFNLMEPNWLQAFDNRAPEGPYGGQRGFVRIETVQRYPQPAVFPGPKAPVGWTRFHIASLHSFVENVVSGLPGSPSFVDGLAVHRVMDAAYLSSQEGRWVEVG